MAELPPLITTSGVVPQELHTYNVLLQVYEEKIYQPPILFVCQALDFDHAHMEAKKAYPDSHVVEIMGVEPEVFPPGQQKYEIWRGRYREQDVVHEPVLLDVIVAPSFEDACVAFVLAHAGKEGCKTLDLVNLTWGDVPFYRSKEAAQMYSTLTFRIEQPENPVTEDHFSVNHAILCGKSEEKGKDPS